MRSLCVLAFTLLLAPSLCMFAQTRQTTGPGEATPETLSITIQFTIHAWGLPNQVDAFVLPSSPDCANNACQISVTTSKGVSGRYPIEAMTFNGNGNTTTLFVSILDVAGSGSYNNTFQLTDGNATPYLNGEGYQIGRQGTFTSIVGTGAFNGATVNMPYVFKCTDNADQCFNGSPTPATTNFQSVFVGGGTIVSDPPGNQQSPPPPVPKATGFGSGRFKITWPPGGGIDFEEIPTSVITLPTSPNSSGARVWPNTSATSAAPDGAFDLVVPFEQAPIGYATTVACPNLPSTCWITLPSPNGSLPAFTGGSVEADMNFGSLGTGIYPANFSTTITATDGSFPPITQNQTANLIVNPNPSLQLSENAITFKSSEGSASQILASITLSTPGSLTYQATPSALTGNWLSVAPASGSVSSTSSASLGILVNPSGLAAGTYFGRVDVVSPDASTAWQPIEVELTVLAPASGPPIFSTTGLIFTAPQGAFPEPQSVQVSTFSNQPITISPGTDDNELAWLKVDASSTTLQPGQTIKQSVLVGNSTLTAGVYPGEIFEAIGSEQKWLAVNYIVTPASGTCTPTQLVPVFTSLDGGFEYPAGLPISVQALITDDCGQQVNSGTVTATFAAGDAPAIMSPLGGGVWAGSWLPHGTAPGPAAAGISAESSTGLQGSSSITGAIDANTTLPVVTPGGIVSAANPVSGAPLAPGQFVSIYGSNLGPAAPVSSTGSSYQTTLAGTQVLLGGVAMPLQFVSSGLINAVVPFETPANAIQNLIISANGTYSLPETVVVASAAPGIFTQNESGQGAGVIVVYKDGGTVYETSPTQPASAGDLLLIYTSGLGAVNPAVADGAPGPASPPFAATVNPVTATIGGVPATVSFAGIAPGYVGVYQVNVTVPSGVTPGTNVPVVLTMAGFPSAPVTVTIQ
jgi:uncharacterized protein (TIGR03437 family)